MILDSFVRENKILVYLDDILIPSTTVEENLIVLKSVLLTLKKYKMELNYNKCQFVKFEIQYLGYIVNKNGITLSEEHVKAIMDFPPPKNEKQVQSFLGLSNYFRKFIRDYASITEPLQALLRKSNEFNFNDSCLSAFNLIKGELTSKPILAICDPEAPTEFHTDASSAGFGGILFQKQKKMENVSYFSKSTNKAEKQYHSFELEMLAVVRAVERYHVYLYCIHFTIITDCNSLVFAMSKINLNPRIARWSLLLQNYNFTIIHRSGKNMPNQPLHFFSRYSFS